MDDISRLYTSSVHPTRPDDPELVRWLTKRAIHAMRFFSFHPSTPSPVVSHLLEAGFYDSSSIAGNFPVWSSGGVKRVKDVRVYEEKFEGFVKSLAVIPKEIQSPAEGASPRMLDSLKRRLLLKNIVLADVLDELRSRPLDEKEMIACLTWLFSVDTSGLRELSGELRRQFLHAAVLSMPVATTDAGARKGEEELKIIPLSRIETYVAQQTAGSVIPLDADLPLPPHTFPYALSRALPGASLEAYLGWKALTLTQWLSHTLSLQRGPTLDVQLAARILQIIARSFGSLDNKTKLQVRDMLVGVECVPTREGLKKPGDSYLPKVDVFPDLPVIQFPGTTTGASKSLGKNMDTLLEYLGARGHVELQLIFNRYVFPNILECDDAHDHVGCTELEVGRSPILSSTSPGSNPNLAWMRFRSCVRQACLPQNPPLLPVLDPLLALHRAAVVSDRMARSIRLADRPKLGRLHRPHRLICRNVTRLESCTSLPTLIANWDCRC
jgi:hypothetical protein